MSRADATKHLQDARTSIALAAQALGCEAQPDVDFVLVPVLDATSETLAALIKTLERLARGGSLCPATGRDCATPVTCKGGVCRRLNA